VAGIFAQPGAVSPPAEASAFDLPGHLERGRPHGIVRQEIRTTTSKSETLDLGDAALFARELEMRVLDDPENVTKWIADRGDLDALADLLQVGPRRRAKRKQPL